MISALRFFLPTNFPMCRLSFSLILQAAGEAWNAAQIVANPLIEATSPAFSGRRKLQQLAQVAPLSSPELKEWLGKAGEFWQARAQQGQGLVQAQNFLKNFMQASKYIQLQVVLSRFLNINRI